jgi:hypothetical protein
MRTHLTQSEKILKTLLSGKGYQIERNISTGAPDFRVLSDTGEKVFDIEVKSSIFGDSQINYMTDEHFKSDNFRLAVVSRKSSNALVQIYKLESVEIVPLPADDPSISNMYFFPSSAKSTISLHTAPRLHFGMPLHPPPHPIIFGPEPGVIYEIIPR